MQRKTQRCPKCKNDSLKNANYGYFCEICKYISKKIYKVVNENQQVGASLRFSQKVSTKKKIINPNEMVQKDIEQICIKSYQRTLKKALEQFLEKNQIPRGTEKYNNINKSCKKIWEFYLKEILNKNKLKIGVFKQIVQKSKKILEKLKERILRKQEKIRQQLQSIKQNEQDPQNIQQLQEQDIKNIQEPQRQQSQQQQEVHKNNKDQIQEQNNDNRQINQDKIIIKNNQATITEKTNKGKFPKKKIKKQKFTQNDYQLSEREASTKPILMKPQKQFTVKKIQRFYKQAERSIFDTNIEQMFVQWIINSYIKPETKQNITKLAQKYCKIVSKVYESQNEQFNPTSKHILSQLKNQKSYLNIKTLKKIMKKRNIPINCVKQKEQLKLLLFLDGILKVHLKDSLQQVKDQHLINYLSIYKLKSTAKLLLVNQLLGILRNCVTQETEVQFAHFSFTLIFAIINIALLQNKQTFSIAKIIKDIGQIQIQFDVEETNLLEYSIIENKQYIYPDKIKIVSQQLYRYLKLDKFLNIPVQMSTWLERTVEQLQLNQWKNQILLIGQTFWKHKEYNAKYKTCKRLLFLEQSEHCIAIILIFLKLFYGISTDPYLINLNINMIKQNYDIDDQDHLLNVEILQFIDNRNSWPQIFKKPLNLISILMKISQNRQKQQKSYLIGYKNYNDLKNLSVTNLIKSFKIYEHNIKFPAPASYKYIPIKFLLSKFQQFPKVIFKKQLIEQLFLGSQLIDLSRIKKYQIDHPSTNYELYIDYQTNKIQINRDLMQFTMKMLVGQNFEYKKIFEFINFYQKTLKYYEK